MTHQCFLTNRAVYLLVWNVLDGDAGIQGLSIWLQNLQVRKALLCITRGKENYEQMHRC